ncbi:hypothetical protein [Listeria cornellensis]|uniref:Uncharacterized protein n=1 Tax=Listeria cornellensis FSL F6-0969 TaxID=1265820 RepID=W7C932_9LIST|nr:hypothetical protein [Listeria cornellensis]EUJ32206.1 hypothetical protein PCORN_02486 [Listeria cornellensis FSL F6-0969]
MKSPWIPVFYHKEENKNYFYNLEEKRLVEGSYSSKSTILILISGTVGVILYALLKSVVIKMTIFHLTLLSIVSGVAVSFVIIFIIDYFARKNIYDKNVSQEEAPIYFKEGEKQFKKNMMISFWTILLALSSTLILYTSNGEVLLFFATTLFWVLPITIFVLQRPFKRRKIYALKQFHKSLFIRN